MTETLMAGEPCTRCGTTRLLRAPISKDFLCADCWRAMGRPFPRFAKAEDAQR